MVITTASVSVSCVSRSITPGCSTPFPLARGAEEEEEEQQPEAGSESSEQLQEHSWFTLQWIHEGAASVKAALCGRAQQRALQPSTLPLSKRHDRHSRLVALRQEYHE